MELEAPLLMERLLADWQLPMGRQLVPPALSGPVYEKFGSQLAGAELGQLALAPPADP
jgi:hypothetical protein